MEERKCNGVLFSPTDLRDFRVSNSVENVQLPATFMLEPKRIKDQGTVNSCVAHSLSSMLENKWKKDFSVGFIYGYRPEGYYQGEGMYPREALKTLQKVGDVKEEDFPFNEEMQEIKHKVDNNKDLLEVEAEDNKISAYARLYSINEIKSWLYTKEIAVPIAIATEKLELDEDNIIQIPKEYPNYGHEMLIIGWDEYGFIVQNSWGEYWGDKGLATLPYEYKIQEAWGVTLTKYQKENDIKKPSFNIIRKIIMIIIQALMKTFKGGN